MNWDHEQARRGGDCPAGSGGKHLGRDPLLRFIDREEAPPSFWRMPPPLRSQRARLYITARCAGADPGLAWIMAMDVSEAGSRYAREVVDERAHPDELYEAAVRREFGVTGL